jgi:signal transduction histidine kinase
LLDGRLGELAPQQREVLQESEQSCARLIKIINSLLDLSRIETGKLELFTKTMISLLQTCREANEGVFRKKAALGRRKVGKGLAKFPLRP